MKLLVFFLSLHFFSSLAFGQEYPLHPDSRLTPGELCQIGNTFRYPERIRYCERDVAGELKQEIFQDYRRLGYGMRASRRDDYKIDHYIPLCAGGSNAAENLWPQHRSVFELTDQLEFLACEVLKKGKISQRSVVELIRLAKNNHREIPSITRRLVALNR